MSFDFRHVDDHSCQCIISYDISVTPFFHAFPATPLQRPAQIQCIFAISHWLSILLYCNTILGWWKSETPLSLSGVMQSFLKKKNVSMRNVTKTGDCLLMPSSPTVLPAAASVRHLPRLFKSSPSLLNENKCISNPPQLHIMMRCQYRTSFFCVCAARRHSAVFQDGQVFFTFSHFHICSQ